MTTEEKLFKETNRKLRALARERRSILTLDANDKEVGCCKRITPSGSTSITNGVTQGECQDAGGQWSKGKC